MSTLKKFIDIGANLTDSMYQGVYNGSKKHEADLDRVLDRSWNAGLNKIFITAGNLTESEKALELAQTDDRLFSTVGCHPTRCTEFEKDGENPSTYLSKLKAIIERGASKIIAIGECGLDYDRIRFCPKDIQKKYFEMQLQLSEHYKLPLFLHCRNAADDLYDILKNHNFRGVVHSFDGTIEEANRFIDLGYFIGLNGCSLKTKENLETVVRLPEDKIMIETDCPWCEIRPTSAGYSYISKDSQDITSVKKEKWKPDSLVKSRNEPCNIGQVLDVIAAVRNANRESLMDKIYENTQKLFFPQEC